MVEQMRLKFLFAIILILISEAYASKAKITGKVLCDNNCKNIQGGVITLKIIDTTSEGEEISAKIKRNGKYAIKYPSKYKNGKITINCSNHLPFTKWIRLSGKNVKKDYLIKELKSQSVDYLNKIESSSSKSKGVYNPYYWDDDQARDNSKNELISEESSKKKLSKKNVKEELSDVDIVNHTKKLRAKYELYDSDYSARMQSAEVQKNKAKRELERKVNEYSESVRQNKYASKNENQAKKEKLKTKKPSFKNKSTSPYKPKKESSYSSSKNTYTVSDEMIFYNLVIHQEKHHSCSSVNRCYEYIGKEYKKTAYEIKQIAFKGIINNWKIP